MKAVKLITKILAVILVTLVAFLGVYVQKQNRMENKVKDYSFGMDLSGARKVELTVSDETKEITKDKDGKIVDDDDKEENGDYTTEKIPLNLEEAKTTENYLKSKEIIEKRLGKLGINNYTIRLDDETGKMIIEIPENDKTDHIVSNFSQAGKFKIVDSENTENVLMDNSDIKNATVMYNTGTTGTTVYLSIDFTKTGAEKLKNISIEYAKVEESSNDSKEEESSEKSNKEETKQKEITMQVDDNKMITTSFSETMENGKLQLTMGQPTKDQDKLKEYVESATTIATILDTGNLPVEYEVEKNEYIASDITNDMLIKIAIVTGSIILIALAVLAVRYKGLGIISAIEYIGFISIYSLLIRYTNVIITLEGIAAIAVILVLNYVYNYKLLNKIKKTKEDTNTAMKNTFVDFCIKIIPICILSIVFCFISWTPISSFGMTMFWGLLLMAIYNLTVTRSFFKK